MARNIPKISDTGLRRTRGGANCNAISIPPDPTPGMNPAQKDAALDAQDQALARREACYRGNIQELDRQHHDLLRALGRERDT